MEIKSVCPQTAPCRNGDAGSCVIGFYFVEDGDILKMCSETGRPTGKSYKLREGDNERGIAARLTLEAWRKTANQSDFNRPLRYGPSGVA